MFFIFSLSLSFQKGLNHSLTPIGITKWFKKTTLYYRSQQRRQNVKNSYVLWNTECKMELKESRIAKNAKYLSPCRILTIHMLWGPLKKKLLKLCTFLQFLCLSYDNLSFMFVEWNWNFELANCRASLYHVFFTSICPNVTNSLLCIIVK